MTSAKIQCPGCKNRFTVKTPSIEKLASSNFRCPKCGTSAPFASLLPQTQVTATKHPGTRVAPITSLPPVNEGGAPDVLPFVSVLLKVQETGKVFPLGQGSYTVGRDSNDGNANIKVAPDVYMSRMQGKVDVSARGCFLTSLNDTNPVIINGRKLEVGQPLELKDGDEIYMGTTNIKVIKK